ncbi:MAG TPA: hydroxyisourate hydrolase [Pyrinomonadaceae bacterium]
MSAITTHVLDTSLGRPARGVPITLEAQDAQGHWLLVGHGSTDTDGRLTTLMPDDAPATEGVYRLTFDTRGYFAAHHVEGFYPQVSVVFQVRDASQHYHVPLLLNPYGYSTYRGS